jgi:hypothetical protein
MEVKADFGGRRRSNLGAKMIKLYKCKTSIFSVIIISFTA